MLRRLNPEIALGFLIATILWIGVLGWSLSYAPTEIEKKECQEATKKSGRKTEECKTFWERTTSDPIALYALGSFIFTAVIGVSTSLLWRVTSTAANAALRQADVMMAVESPLPLVVGFNIVQYSQIPGETVIADPFPPGPLQPNCRITFCIENKGRTPLPLLELCVEKFAGTSLPQVPPYIHIVPWGLVLEKGPIWIRAHDALVEITVADVGAAEVAYQANGAFWVYGYFAYRNLLDERIEHKFLARWDMEHGFAPENRPGYT
jgi:hypothetical protein